MSDLPISEPEQAVPPRFDAPLVPLIITLRSLLALAFYWEQVARSCEQDGGAELGALLRQDAARFRRWAVDA